MTALKSISRKLASLAEALTGSPCAINRLRMVLWTAEVNRIVRNSPGCNDGFTAEEIDSQANTDFSAFSTWTIFCEEMLDTQFPRSYFESARAELRRRGITDDKYHDLRRFAWLTAGWLNCKTMLWEWKQLDESDMKLALERQLTYGWISSSEHDRRLEFVDRYAAGVEGTPTQPSPA